MATPSSSAYLLRGGSAEIERLRLQARMWEPEAEVLLDRIDVQTGWRCLDLGCGAMGILGPLSRRVGPGGQVVGVDRDPQQIAAAWVYVQEQGFGNVEVLDRDAYATGLPDHSFDLVHVRFVFAPAGHDDALLAEMRRLVRPGGVLAIEEPDVSCWSCHPQHPAWDRLKTAISDAFAHAGGDFNAGRGTYGLLRQAGVANVQVRTAALALQGGHPYMRLPMQFTTSLRSRILDAGLLTAGELDEALAACEDVVKNPATWVSTFLLVQVWGQLPASEAG